MATQLESNQVGVRESLADLIAVVDSDATPYTSMLEKRKKPINVIHDWQVKAYPPMSHSGVPDNKDASNFSSNPRQRLHGVSQKVWNLPSVSDFAEEVEVAGAPQGEMAEQVADGLIILARAKESRFLSNNDCALESQPGTANETRGAFQWLSPNAQSLYPIPAAFRPSAAQLYSGTLANFSEAALIALAQAAYKNRKKKIKLAGVCGVGLKNQISTFSKYDTLSNTSAPIRRFNQDAEDKQMISVIDRVVLDTCEIDLFISSFLYTNAADGTSSAYSDSSGVFLDMNMVALHYMRLPRVKPLPYLGGGYRAIVDSIVLHVVDNPLGMFSAAINS